MKKLLKKIINDNHMVSIFGTMLFNVFMGLSFLLIVRTYSKEVLGQWIIYSTGVPLLEMFRSGLLYTALIKFSAGNNQVHKNEQIIGSIWVLAIISTLLITGFLYICYFSFSAFLIQKGFLLFFQLFPFQFFLFLPISICFPILISQQKFDKLLMVKLAIALPSLFFLSLNYLILKLDIFWVVIINILTALPVIVFCIANGFSGLQYIIRASKKMIIKILNYGKFTMFTLLAANLLRSSDIFIIGLFLTNTDVANYGIPLKIVSIFEGFLGSLYDVAMPSISKEANTQNKNNLRKYFYNYSFFVSLLILVFIICFFFFRKTVIYIIGGANYLESPEVLTVLTIFLFSFLLHPIDRFSGITLDSISKPEKNLKKVVIMVLVNIIGDILVLFFFKSIILVAFITWLNLIIGALIGIYYLKIQINTNFSDFRRCIVNEVKFRLSHNFLIK